MKAEELDAIISFLFSIQNVNLQSDLINMIINLIETSLLKHDFNEQYYFIFYEQNMCEHFYAYLIQPSIEDSIKEKIFRLIKILLFKMKKISDRYKQRLRLVDMTSSGSINGLLSKMLSNTAFFQTQAVTNKLISESFIFNLLEIFLDLSLDSSLSFPKSPELAKKVLTNQIYNYDSLWTIMSLLTPSVLCLNNYWQNRIDEVEQIRLKLCKFLLLYVNEVNVLSVQYLVKSYSWQDILCQYLCYSHKPIENISHKIVIVETQRDESQLIKDDLLTSTPTNQQTQQISNREKQSLRDLKKFSMFSTSINYSMDDKMKSFNENDELNDNTDDLSKAVNGADENVELSKSNNNQNNNKSIEQHFDFNEINNDKNKEIDNETTCKDNSLENDGIKNSLCDTIVNLLFKLSWHGFSGSNETIWKVKSRLKLVRIENHWLLLFFFYRNDVKYFQVYIA